MNNRNIDRISNELEFNLHRLEAPRLISYNGLPIMGEVNPRDVVEMNISMADGVDELNQNVGNYVSRLIQNVDILGGSIYGGASVIADTSSLIPKYHRTTSCSEACGRGFLDITSQQIVIGVTEEQLGFELYNSLRQLGSVLIAMSASSPYRYNDGAIEDVGAESRRIIVAIITN